MQYARDVYGKTLVELGRNNPNIVVLDADLSGSTRTAFFAREFPDRFFNFGVAEQNMMATAAGLASCGKTVFVSTFAMFATARCWDQIRNTICYSNSNVKIVATHAGITVGPDGSSHQALEDIALMHAIPNMTVVVPCDAEETKEAILVAAEVTGPVYIRLGRSKISDVEGKKSFKIGKGYILNDGKDVSIIACGIMVKSAQEAAKLLNNKGISTRVINIHTIRPLDKKIIIEAAKQTRGIVVCEEHAAVGGLGSAVDDVVLGSHPTKLLKVGIKNRFGQSGDSEGLLKEYNLTVEDIVKTVKKILR